MDSRLQQLAKTDRNPAEETEYQALLKASGGNAGGGLNIPAFNFNYGQAEIEARAKLEPYYKQKLLDAKGDVELAKKYIEEDYARGMRTAAEDEATSKEAEALTVGQENRDLLATLNKRGVLFSEQPTDTGRALVQSGIAGQEVGNLTSKQALRKQAIERALQRQQEVAGIDRQRGIEAQNTLFPRQEQALAEEKENRVQTQFVPAAQERARAAYDNTYGQSLNQAVNRSVNANPYLQQLGWA